MYRRVTGRFRIDEWGFDRDVLTTIAPFARLRWRIQTEAEHLVPEIGPALLVYSRRVGVSEPIVLGSAVLSATGRALRGAGAPGRAPLALPARKIGGVPSNSADLRSLMRAGELVSWPLSRELLHPFHVPAVPVGPIEVALDAGAPILPVAVLGLETGRRWVVRFGPPIVTRRRRTTAEAAQLADETRRRIQRLITEHQRRRR